MKSPVATLPTSIRPGDLLAVLVLLPGSLLARHLGRLGFLSPAGMLEEFYDAQAQSLLEGRIDVPPDAIGPEAFVHDGKSYGYFGPTPALARLPLEVFMPAMYGRWSRASMLAASLLAMLSVLLFFRRLERHLGLDGHPKLRGAASRHRRGRRGPRLLQSLSLRRIQGLPGGHHLGRRPHPGACCLSLLLPDRAALPMAGPRLRRGLPGLLRARLLGRRRTALARHCGSRHSASVCPPSRILGREVGRPRPPRSP